MTSNEREEVAEAWVTGMTCNEGLDVTTASEKLDASEEEEAEMTAVTDEGWTGCTRSDAASTEVVLT